MEEKEKKKKITTSDFDLEELMDCLEDNVKEDIVDFSDVINLKCSLDREIFLGDITLYDGSCNDNTQNGGGTQERLPDRAGGSQHPADT